ncbi:MAG: helix-hairpin-helix domain-containing protein [Saprospiraceae bacterium]
MKAILSNYFYGTKNELRGVTFLFCVISIIVVIRFLSFKPSPTLTIDKQDFHEKASMIAALNITNIDKSFNNNITQNTATQLFYFNPNIASKSDFERLGLSSRTAQSIINYRDKGGKFFKPQDFKKIYTLSDSDYNRLSSYINIPTNDSDFGESHKKEKVVENRVVELFEFNPNIASKSDFERLGLSSRTAQSIINYRDKGGMFYKPQDFKKIYTLSDADYQRLETYIQLPKKTKAIAEKEEDESPKIDFSQIEKPQTDYIKKSSTVKIDINKASVEDFQQLKGVGKGYAKRIIKYRDKLGGFTSTNQLNEIYGFPKETYEVIKEQLVIKSKTITKININTAMYKDLVNHPYIDSKRANAIVKYRKQHGKFKSVDDLAKIYAISKSTLKTIKPYLKV